MDKQDHLSRQTHPRAFVLVQHLHHACVVILTTVGSLNNSCVLLFTMWIMHLENVHIFPNNQTMVMSAITISSGKTLKIKKNNVYSNFQKTRKCYLITAKPLGTFHLVIVTYQQHLAKIALQWMTNNNWMKNNNRFVVHYQRGRWNIYAVFTSMGK